MLHMAFIGLGQAGGRIVDTFLGLDSTHYVGMAINTAVNDLDGLKHVPKGNRFALRGNSYGAGRTPELAKQVLLENAFEVGEKAREVARESQFVWLVAGLGGGTGTGCLDFMLDYLDGIFDDQKVGLIVTIPRDDDGVVQKVNAVGVLKKIHTAIVQEKVCAVLVVDNERFYTQLAENLNSTADWRDQSNKMVARTLHQINELTIASGYSNFDRMDLLNFLSYPGCLAIGRAPLRKSDMSTVLDQVRSALVEGYFSSGYRFEEAKSFACCFTLDKEMSAVRSAAYEKAISTELRSLAPHVLDTYYAYYQGERDQSSVLTLAAGLGLPERVFALTQQIEVRKTEIKAFDAPEVPNVSQLTAIMRPRPQTSAAISSNPFKTKTAVPQTASISPNNPFRRVR